MKTRSPPALRWSLALLSLSILYLVVEFAFNATLLNVAGGLEIDETELLHTEYFGRSVSGAGFALLVMSFAWQRIRKPVGLLAVVVLAWATMFFGQKWVIEQLYIDHSTWEQRLTAQYMHLFKVALGRNLIEVEGLPYNYQQTERPEEKAFMALVGGLVMDAPEFLESIRSEKDALIQRVVASTANESLDARYADYRRQGDRFEQQYAEYAEGSKAYDRNTRGAQMRANEAWVDLFTRLDGKWDAYQQAKIDFQKQADRQARNSSADMAKFYDGFTQCRSQSCDQRYLDRYNPKMQQQFGQEVHWAYWCEPVYLSAWQKSTSRRGNTLNIDPFKYLRSLASDHDTRKPDHFECGRAHLPEEMTPRILALKQDDFEKRTGYPSSVGTKAAFLDHPATARKVRAELVAKGLPLANNWALDNHAGFKRAYVTHISQEAEATWQHKMIALVGASVPPKLSYKSFTQHAAMQAKIAREMGDNYVPNFHFEMSEADFKRRVLDPKVVKKVRAYIRALEDDAEAFANGGAREADGKRYMRAVVIPPISLFLSLFFALLTLGKNGVTLLNLGLLHAPGLKALPEIAKRRVRTAAWATVAACLLVPPFLLENKYSESEAFQYFETQAFEETSIGKTLFANYVIRLQPVIYPVGQAVVDAARSLRLPEALAFSVKAAQSADPRLAEWQAKADYALTQDWLMTPEEKSAFTYYRKILGLDPTHAAARAGLTQIVTLYEGYATRAEARADIGKASLYRMRANTVKAILDSENG